MHIQEISQDPEVLLTEQQSADFLGFSTRALQNWRVKGGGPNFVKISSRAVRYRRRDLLRWTDERVRSSTSQMQPKY